MNRIKTFSFIFFTYLVNPVNPVKRSGFFRRDLKGEQDVYLFLLFFIIISFILLFYHVNLACPVMVMYGVNPVK